MNNVRSVLAKLRAIAAMASRLPAMLARRYSLTGPSRRHFETRWPLAQSLS